MNLTLSDLSKTVSGERHLADIDLELATGSLNVAMVYQQFINDPSFTVFENIAAPLRRAGVGEDEVRERVQKVAAALQIEPLLERLQRPVNSRAPDQPH